MKADYWKEMVVLEIGREEALRLRMETVRCLCGKKDLEGIRELDRLLTDYLIFLKTQGVPS